MTGANENSRRSGLICAGLLGFTLALYWPVRHFDFLNYDDQDYVTANVQVQTGVTAANVGWAFTTAHAGNWHPLTWLSHMLDWQLFGPASGGPHLVNVILHALNSVLLFLALQRMTTSTWRSAFVAGLFAFHPLHVESVAWIAERKDVLSALFFMLTLLAYAHYTESSNQKPVTSNQRLVISGPWLWYTLALLAFTLGLMSKQMLVTMPFVLLLLDCWPLRRFGLETDKQTIGNLLLEKVPFLFLSIIASVLAFRAQRLGGNVAELSLIPFGTRCQNALLSYVLYLRKAIWPDGLAVFYPYPSTLPLGTVVLAAVALAGLTTVAIWSVKRRPYVMVGWFWYLGTLVPVLGLVQIGLQAMADRYTYLPLVGVFIMLSWGVSELTQFWRRGQLVLAPSLGAVLVGCFVLSRIQLGTWRNSEALFRHALEVTGWNPMAEWNLGSALLDQRRPAEAVTIFTKAVRLAPQSGIAHLNLGLALGMSRRPDEAIAEYRTALALEPSFARSHAVLANALLSEGKREEAIGEYEAALKADPDCRDALNDLAWVLATDPDPAHRNGQRAAALAERLCRLTQFREPQFIGTLAAAYAEAHRFDEAVSHAQNAAALADTIGLKELAERNRQLCELYRQNQAYHERE